MHPSRNLFGFYSSKGFVLSDQLITRYTLSLTTKPFSILSGISGTGKTKIAQLFADYMLQGESEQEKIKRQAFISVRPDWTDNRGLLGYYNLLDQCYYSTPILRLLLEARDNPEKPYFVILDEMNLSKVEYYFSDFLSIMESRTEDRPEGERLHLHNAKGDIGDSAGNPIPADLHIPANVYFTGTVNLDETTYMFSPKVLDRANVIEFNEVDLRGTAGPREMSSFRLSSPEILEVFHSAESRAFCHFGDFKDGGAREEIAAIKDILERTHHHFGYRVANEMARFINLSDQLVGEQQRQSAIDIQILQKVLPKFHGTKSKLEPPLKEMQSYCDERGFRHSAGKLEIML